MLLWPGAAGGTGPDCAPSSRTMAAGGARPRFLCRLHPSSDRASSLRLAALPICGKATAAESTASPSAEVSPLATRFPIRPQRPRPCRPTVSDRGHGFDVTRAAGVISQQRRSKAMLRVREFSVTAASPHTALSSSSFVISFWGCGAGSGGRETPSARPATPRQP